MIKKIVFCILLIIIVFLMYYLIGIIKTFFNKKKVFIKKLEDMGDIETLIELGFYNKVRYKEERRIPYMVEVLQEKYSKTKNPVFYEFGRIVQKTSISIVSIILTLFIIVIILRLLVL